MSPARPDNSRFLLLDFLRGVAAISVLLYHSEHAGFLGVQLLPSAYLAVDMFFLLSGFVIAHNYDGKIAAGMSFSNFMAQRLIRLYPCLLLALALGVLIYSLRMTSYEGYLDSWGISASAAFNALFLPSVVQAYGHGGYFPFNGAAWSLTFELIANLFYWLTFRQLTGARLALLIFAAGVLFMVGANFVGTMDIGMRTSDFWWGIPRVTLTFFMGVALRRYFHERVSINLGNRAAVLALVSLILVFSMSRELEWRHGSMVAGFAMLIVVFPALLLVVAGATPGPRVGALCRWTGDASYPVYLLQTPLMGVAAAIPQVVWGRKAAEFIPWIGIAFIVGTILISLWVDRRFELPLRKWLKARWQRFSKPLP